MSEQRGLGWVAGALFTLGLLLVLRASSSAPARAESQPTSTQINQDQLFYAYVGAGENLDVSIAKLSGVDITVTVSRPGAADVSCSITSQTGSCTWSDLTASSPGIWRVNFDVQNTNGALSTWTVQVQNGSTNLPGRVFTEQYSMSQPVAIDLTLWYRSELGYTYKAVYPGYDGVASIIRSDATGVRQGTSCTSAYRSITTVGANADAGYSQPALGECGDPYKIFFTDPAADLPPTATRWDGTTTWLKPPVVVPQVASLTFTPNHPLRQSGTFSFDVSDFTGQMALDIDANGDGDYTDPVDRSIPVFTTGTSTVAFDGRDGQGTFISAEQPINARARIDRIGEIHFSMGDVEGRRGIEVTRLNGPGSPETTVYWDDTAFATQSSQRCSTSTPLDGRAGVASTGGVHGWVNCGNANNGISGSHGDARVIDDWTYAKVDVRQPLAVPARGIPTITVRKAVPDRLDPADQFTVSLLDSAGTVLSSATTSGSEPSAATTPVIVTEGGTYTLRDAIAAGSVSDLGMYDASIVCTDTTAGATVPVNGSGPTWTVTSTDHDLDCTITNSPKAGAFEVTKEGSVVSAGPGQTVTYTVTLTNTGPVPYTAARPAGFTDSLADVLDDATYNGDVTGGASFAGDTLSWSGPLAVGATRTFTYSVTVIEPDAGDGELGNTAVPTGTGGRCVGANSCTPPVAVRSYSVSKSADVVRVAPGGRVTYTVTVTNTGGYSFTTADPARFTDDLSDVLDDASYNGDVSAGGSLTSNTLAWSGSLPRGGTVIVTYSVTVNQQPTDHDLVNVVAPGPDGRCTTCTTTTGVASYTVTKVASTSAARPGGRVTYAVTVSNTGQVAYTVGAPATFDDDLSAVLDDATYGNDAESDDPAATVTYDEPTLSWSGPLAVGATTVVTYSVELRQPPAGDGVLTNAVVTPPEGGCPAGAGAARCTATTNRQEYRVVKTTDATRVVPGQVVNYTITVTNTGSAPFSAADPATFTDDLSGVLDDGTYNEDAGTGATYAEPILSWSGPLPVGGEVAVAYSVTIDDPVTGDRVLRNQVITPPGGSCPDGSPLAACRSEVPGPSLEISKIASTGSARPGDRVIFTVTLANTGSGDFTTAAPARFTDDLSQVLDDAEYEDDATGGATYAEPVLSWSGPIAAGDEVVITYSVTVRDGGDGQLRNTVVSPISENCPPPGDGPECTTVVAMARQDPPTPSSSTTSTSTLPPSPTTPGAPPSPATTTAPLQELPRTGFDAGSNVVRSAFLGLAAWALVIARRRLDH